MIKIGLGRLGVWLNVVLVTIRFKASNGASFGHVTQPQVAWFGLWPRLIIIWCEANFFLGNVEYPIGGDH
jgi:hypothetical protein